MPNALVQEANPNKTTCYGAIGSRIKWNQDEKY